MTVAHQRSHVMAQWKKKNCFFLSLLHTYTSSRPLLCVGVVRSLPARDEALTQRMSIYFWWSLPINVGRHVESGRRVGHFQVYPVPEGPSS